MKCLRGLPDGKPSQAKLVYEKGTKDENFNRWFQFFYESVIGFFPEIGDDEEKGGKIYERNLYGIEDEVR